ncbi:MAG: deoxyribonuclease V [Anaerolineae bacterium]|nr:deoxyribonuclease V [Anaerolineae bacterium]
MMPATHSWDVSPAQARAIQTRLRRALIIAPPTRAPENIAGIDVSIRGETAKAAIALLSYPSLELLEATTAEVKVSFPYVPGLLAFREGPAVLAALERLSIRPDMLMFDAQGIAHPRRMGLATHIGILLDMPSIGCAKSRLCGEYSPPEKRKGSWTPLYDKGEVIGAVVRTRDNVRPVFVSVGHRVDLEAAVAMVLSCATRYRLPEPTRQAHRIANSYDR